MKHSQAWKKRGKVWVRWAIRFKSIRFKPDCITFEWYKQTFDPKAEYSLGVLCDWTVLNAQTVPYFEDNLKNALSYYMPKLFLNRIFFGVDI